jgi:hypothetical protein
MACREAEREAKERGNCMWLAADHISTVYGKSRTEEALLIFLAYLQPAALLP